MDMKKQSLVVKIDDREDGRGPKQMYDIVKDKAEEYGFSVARERLEVGDYSCNGIGIERKEMDYRNIPDVLAKADELKSQYTHAFIFISCDLMSLDITKRTDDEMKYLTGLTASLIARGVYPIFCSSRQIMATTMIKTFDKLLDDKKRVIVQPIRPQPSRQDWRIHVLSSFPGIGDSIAENILKEFDSIQDFINASLEEKMKVEGIGKSIANKVNEIVRNRE